MKAWYVSASLFLLAIIWLACGSGPVATGTVTIEAPDFVMLNVERAFNPKWYALYAVKGTAPQTFDDMTGRQWILCSHYRDSSNNLLWLSQNAAPLKIGHFNLITGPDSKRKEMLSSCQDAFKTEPRAILVMDRKIKFKFPSEMIELKLK
jgi:hypothetical protein